MEITYFTSSGKVFITLIGELDESCAETVRKKLDEIISTTECNSVVFDLSRLSFMDSTGIGVLIGRYKLAQKRNISLFVRRPSVTVDKIFVMSGLYDIISKIG